MVNTRQKDPPPSSFSVIDSLAIEDFRQFYFLNVFTIYTFSWPVDHCLFFALSVFCILAPWEVHIPQSAIVTIKSINTYHENLYVYSISSNYPRTTQLMI